MKLFKISSSVLAIVLITQFGYASPSVPDLQLSEAFISYPGPGMVTLLVVPDGSGIPFTQAKDPAGNPVDATITLTILDALGDNTTFASYPREDLWLQFAGGTTLPTCAAPLRGLVADHNADAVSTTHWIASPHAGGYNEGPAIVFINGSALQGTPGLPIRFNSPDITGDLAVDLSDVAVLAGDFFTGYHFRSDMNADGVLNLSDIAVFAGHLGVSCP
jgi:hypothetical protein